MRFERTDGSITYYQETSGKQEGDVFVVRFGYGRSVDETTDLQFNEDSCAFSSFDEMRQELDDLKEYCLYRGYTQVKAKRKHVIT